MLLLYNEGKPPWSAARQKERDVQAWLLIGAIFIGTMLAVWLPLLFSAMHSKV